MAWMPPPAPNFFGWFGKQPQNNLPIVYPPRFHVDDSKALDLSLPKRLKAADPLPPSEIDFRMGVPRINDVPLPLFTLPFCQQIAESLIGQLSSSLMADQLSGQPASENPPPAVGCDSSFMPSTDDSFEGEDGSAANNLSTSTQGSSSLSSSAVSGGGFRCRECNKVLPTQVGLKRHLFYHTKPFINSNDCPYRCEICSAAFTYRTSLEYHRVSHRLNGSERLSNGTYKCQGCGKSFDGLKTLKRHKMRRASNDTCSATGYAQCDDGSINFSLRN